MELASSCYKGSVWNFGRNDQREEEREQSASIDLFVRQLGITPRKQSDIDGGNGVPHFLKNGRQCRVIRDPTLKRNSRTYTSLNWELS